MKTKTTMIHHLEANMVIITIRDNWQWEFVQKAKYLCIVNGMYNSIDIIRHNVDISQEFKWNYHIIQHSHALTPMCLHIEQLLSTIAHVHTCWVPQDKDSLMNYLIRSKRHARRCLDGWRPHDIVYAISKFHWLLSIGSYTQTCMNSQKLLWKARVFVCVDGSKKGKR